MTPAAATTPATYTFVGAAPPWDVLLAPAAPALPDAPVPVAEARILEASDFRLDATEVAWLSRLETIPPNSLVRDERLMLLASAVSEEYLAPALLVRESMILGLASASRRAGGGVGIGARASTAPAASAGRATALEARARKMVLMMAVVFMFAVVILVVEGGDCGLYV